MGGRKSYSVKRVTGKGLGKYKKPLKDSINREDSTEIAINTTKIATESKKQQKEFSKFVTLLDYVSDEKKEPTKKVSKSIEKLKSKYGIEKNPLSKEESNYLSYALKRKRRQKK